MMMEKICLKCGRVHAASFACLSVLVTANSNFEQPPADKPRRRLSIAESIARNKTRYAKTLERLS